MEVFGLKGAVWCVLGRTGLRDIVGNCQSSIDPERLGVCSSIVGDGEVSPGTDVDRRALQRIPAGVAVSSPEIPISTAVIVDDVAVRDRAGNIVPAGDGRGEAAGAVSVGPHREGETGGVQRL